MYKSFSSDHTSHVQTHAQQWAHYPTQALPYKLSNIHTSQTSSLAYSTLLRSLMDSSALVHLTSGITSHHDVLVSSYSCSCKHEHIIVRIHVQLGTCTPHVLLTGVVVVYESSDIFSSKLIHELVNSNDIHKCIWHNTMIMVFQKHWVTWDSLSLFFSVHRLRLLWHIQVDIKSWMFMHSALYIHCLLSTWCAWVILHTIMVWSQSLHGSPNVIKRVYTYDITLNVHDCILILTIIISMDYDDGSSIGSTTDRCICLVSKMHITFC